MRAGVERMIDMRNVVVGEVVGDVALLEPGKIVPCDGVFLSGHNVCWDKSGATGESDAIKKLSYKDCIMRRNKKLAEHESSGGKDADSAGKALSEADLLGHTDCFVISRSKTLEGVGSYVAHVPPR